MELFLLGGECFHALFQIPAHEILQTIAVEANDRLEQCFGENGLAELFLLGDDLQQNQAGDVVARLVFYDPHFLALYDELPDVLQRDMPGLRRVVQASIRVLFDQALRLAHRPSLACSREQFSQCKIRLCLGRSYAVSPS